ncbi:MAG: murein hydrolase activator EnvC family protein [Porticoccaceae bacterium]
MIFRVATTFSIGNPLRLSLLVRFVLICSVLLCNITNADDSQQKELDSLKRSISTLERKLEDRGKQRNSLQSALKKVELESSKINRNIRRLRNKINNLEKQLKTLDQKEKNLQQNISQQSDAISEQITAAHQLGDQEPIKLLLNQEDPQQLARVLKYYDYFLKARADKIQRYKKDIDDLSATKAEIKRQKLALDQSKKALEADKKTLSNRVKSRKKTLDKLQLSLRTDKKKLSKLQSERNKLEEIIETVKKAAAKLAPPANYESFASRKGKLKWPLKGRVAHSFGSKRSGTLRWEGWLISAKAGDAVKTVHHGRVVFSNYLRGFGLLVIVDHGDGYMTLYAHNQELLRETGDWVQSNEVVSRAGDTGGLNKPALYFEIRKKGNPADPKVWLGKR